MSNKPSEIDLSDPESVVRAAVPSSELWPRYPAHSDDRIMCIDAEGWRELGRSKTIDAAWREALKHPTVQAFIAANRPEEAKDGE